MSFIYVFAFLCVSVFIFHSIDAEFLTSLEKLVYYALA